MAARLVVILGEVIVAVESEQESCRGSSTETAVVDALLEARGHLSGLPDGEVLVVLRELAARRRVLDAALVEVAGELLRREDESLRSETVARKAGFRSLPALLEQLLGVKPFEAKTLVGVAAVTRERMSFTGEPIPPTYGDVSRALASGLLSVGQAAAITKGLDRAGGRVVVDDVVRAERELVASACGFTPEDEQPAVPKVLEVQAAMWVSYLDPDGVEPRAEKIAEERGLWVSRRADGAVSGKFVATPEQGDQLLSVLDAVLSPRRSVEFPAASGCGEPVAAATGSDGDGGTGWSADGGGGGDIDRGRDAEGGLGGGSLAGHGHGHSHGDGDGDGGVDGRDADGDAVDGVDAGDVLVDPRSLPQRRMDALEMLVKCYAESPDAPRIGGEAPTLVIVTTKPALAGAPARPEDVPHLEHTGEPVPPSLAARIRCDGFLRTATTTASGEILHLGRRRRLFTPGQRRAIFVRDRHCRAPGCRAPARWCETHHTVPWSEDGPTDVDHGILLCSFHHHEVHRDHLRLIQTPNGRWQVVAGIDHYVRRRKPRRRTNPNTDAPRPGRAYQDTDTPRPEWNPRT